MRNDDRPREILRRDQMRRVTGYGNTQIDELEAKGLLPKRIRLSPGGRAVGWDATEVAEFQRERKAAREAEFAQKCPAVPRGKPAAKKKAAQQ